MTMAPSVGNNVRKLRERRGWTIRELAGHADMQKSVVHRIEVGQKTADADDLLRLATAFGVGVGELFRVRRSA